MTNDVFLVVKGSTCFSRLLIFMLLYYDIKQFFIIKQSRFNNCGFANQKYGSICGRLHLKAINEHCQQC